MSAALDWREAAVPVIAGISDTRKNSDQPYRVRSLSEILSEAKPHSLPKANAFGFIPSLYAANDARSHEAQRQHGRFVALVGDIDNGNHPISLVEDLVADVAEGSAWAIYSTASAKADDRRWRIVIPLAEPASFDDWHDAQLALVDFMAGEFIEMDTCAARPGQLSFLPNVPNEARGPDGEPIFYERATSDMGAPGLSIASGIIAEGIVAIRSKRAADDAERDRIRAEAAKRKASRPISRGEGGSMIDAFNRENTVETLLERYGYKRSPRDGRDWRSPFQTSGSFATRAIEGGKWISLSGSDAAEGLGERCSSGCYGDAFDLFAHFEHGGDGTAALRELHREKEGNTFHGTGHHDPDTGEIYEKRGSKHPEWPEPVDLWRHYAAPSLPAGLLPTVIEDFARKHAEVMGVDPAGLAMAALAVCSAVITDDIKVKVKRYDEWTESARLWVGLVGAPSMKKTPIINAAARPLKAIDSRLMRAFMEKREAYDALPAKERKMATKPKQERRLISDATIEAAQEVLRDSPRGVLSLQDELSGWFGAMDKYAPGKGAMADRGFWLQAFNGGAYSLNRIARGACYIPNCSVGLLGGVQPEPIRAIANDTQDDGLIQRLIPVILRQGSLGRDIPADEAVGNYGRLVESLDLMRPPTRPGILAGPEREQCLSFDDRATIVRETMEAEHHELVKSLEIISPKLAAHFGKHDGLFARLCVLWHCIETEQGNMPGEYIGGATAQRVAEFMRRFLRPSAIAFYAGLLGMSAGHEDIIALAAWIVASGIEEVKPRDVQSSGQALRHVAADEVRLLCEKLEAFGWGRWADPAPKSNKPRFVVNPLVAERFAERGREEQDRRAKAREIIQAALAA